ncbi:MAG: HlyD family efflux transporter periplasmic adaptor subunit [Gemmataceae bacterium]
MLFVKFGLPLLAAVAIGFAVATSMILTPQDQVTTAPNPPAETTLGPETIAGLGEVQSASEPVAVGTPVPGIVREVAVLAGERVRRGALLFSIDDRDLRAELALRQSAVKVAEARVKRARAGTRPEELPPAQARVQAARVALARNRDVCTRVETLNRRGAASQEELRSRQFAVQQSQAELSEAMATLERLEAGTWKLDVEVAEAELQQAQAAVDRVRADLDRLLVRAPVDGVVLRVAVRPGEYVASPAEVSPVILGTEGRCQVRVEVDEEDASRVRAGAPAEGFVRGRERTRVPLTYLRIEPRVVPKTTLTGARNERVDTRVLIVVYEIPECPPHVYPGQKLDVFLHAAATASDS